MIHAQGRQALPVGNHARIEKVKKVMENEETTTTPAAVQPEPAWMAKLREKVDDLKPVDTDERYNDMLDEIYSLESVGGPFAHMQASRVLKEVDPIAYRCGKNDWMDGEDIREFDGKEYDGRDLDNARDEAADELDSELTDLENELEELEEGDDAEKEELKKKIAAMQADISALKQYSF